MADKKASAVKLKTVTVELDKVRHLNYNMNAFAYMEEVFGGIPEAMEALQGRKIKAVLEVLKAGLIHEDETVTVKQIGNSIGLTDFANIVTKINEAMGQQMPEVDEKEAGKN